MPIISATGDLGDLGDLGELALALLLPFLTMVTLDKERGYLAHPVVMMILQSHLFRVFLAHLTTIK